MTSSMDSERRSCLTILLEIMDCWTEILDDDDGIDVSYLDFRIAFDLVSHRHLIYKMSKYDITNQILICVTFFLSHRKQMVVNLSSGVEHRKLLMSQHDIVFLSVCLFADDIKIFMRIISE